MGYFHVPASVNSVAMNTGFHVFFQLWFPRDICPLVRLLGRMVVLFLVFKRSSILFSIVLYQFAFPQRVHFNISFLVEIKNKKG